MEKRFLLFIFLSLAILTIYQSLVVKPVPKPTSRSAPASGSTAATSAQASAPNSPPTAQSPAPASPSSAPAVQAPAPPAAADVPALVGETSERDVTIETRDVIAVFTNRGARLKSWRLKHYLDQDRHPQELIERALPNEPLPFTVQTPNSEANATINNALFAVSGEPAGIVESPTDVRFEYR